MSRGYLPPSGRERRAVRRRAFVDSLPVLMGYTAMGFVAGSLLAAKAGVSFAPLWAFLSGGLCVSGTLSFAIVQPVAERVGIWAIALMLAGVNFRYVFYGWSMLGAWKDVRGWRKFLLVLMLTDENYALETACKYKDPGRRTFYCLCLSAMNLSYWVAGLTSGAAFVSILRRALDPSVIAKYTSGLEFAMAALFIVIFTDQAKGFFAHGK